MGMYEFKKEDAERFAQHVHIKVRVRGNELHFAQCPYCQNMTNDKNTFAINLDTGQFKCLRASCGVQGNMITLSRDFNFSLGNDVDEYYSSRKQFRNLKRYPTPTTKPEAVEYLESRGISEAITNKYNLSIRKDDKSVLVFPFFDEKGQMQFIKYRNMHPEPGQSKEWCERDCKPILFGMNHCDPDHSGMLVITEGQIDSLSVAEAFSGDVNAVSVPTGAKGFTWVPYCWDFLHKFTTLVVFGDHENDHITLLDELSTRFKGTTKHVRPEDYLECKDANELLQKHGKQAVVNAVIRAVPVDIPRIKRVVDVERKSTSDMEKISSGIRSYDRIMGGFKFGQLVLLTGERGKGKSTLASQFGAYAIHQGQRVLFYSGELMDWYFRDWLERQIAGDRHINVLESTLGYKSYMIDGAIRPTMEQWYSDSAYMYSNETVNYEDDDIELVETLENAVMQYECRMLIIDNLMTALDDDLRSDLYRQQAKFVGRLSNMARRLHIIILLVVHPRKSNSAYNFTNDDISGSGDITNKADVILRYDVPDKDDDRGSDRILQILKDRNEGRVNRDGIPLWYEDSSKRISEDPDKFNWAFGWETETFVPVSDDDEEIPFD